MKQCPNCKCEQFKAKLGVIALVTIGDDLKPLVQQTFPDMTTVDEIICAGCNTVIQLEELNTKKCTRCGGDFKSEELNERGLCSLCVVIEERFASCSQEDLIRTILQLEAEKEIALKTDKPAAPKRNRKKPTAPADIVAPDAEIVTPEDLVVATPIATPEVPIVEPVQSINTQTPVFGEYPGPVVATPPVENPFNNTFTPGTVDFDF